jgi:ATP-binding cassette, subfamily B, bacterial MsbA
VAARIAFIKKDVFWQLLALYRWALPTLILLGLLVSLAEALGIGLMIPVFQYLLETGPASAAGPFVGWVDEYARVLNPDHRIMLLGVTIFALILFKAIVTIAHTYLSEWLNGNVAHNLRTRLTKQLLDVEYTYILRQPPGRLIDTLQYQTWRAGDVFSRLGELSVSAAIVAVFGTMLLLISWQVTLAIGAGLVVASAITLAFTRRAKHLGETAVEASQQVTDRALELLDGMRMVHAFSQEKREYERFVESSDHERRSYMATDLVSAVLDPLMEVIYLPLLVLALYTAWKVGIDLPVLFTCLILIYRMLPQLRHLQSRGVDLASLLGAIDDIAQILRTDDKPYLTQGDQQFSELSDRITFNNVSFNYGSRTRDEAQQPDQPAVSDLNFDIRRGEMTAIVGGSGAGKSTVVHLLCRFGDPQKGQILVDDRPLPDLRLDSWRRAIAIAGQDADLFAGTIAENIAYGSPDATQSRIESAARRAEAHAFIAELPAGYGTRIGSRGRSLSAGQRQRVGLARALLTNPCLLILDEATNDLDNTTAAAITETVRKLRGELTIVVIAHRLEAVRHADLIIVLSEGRLIQQGTHEQLRTTSGKFAELYAHERHAAPDFPETDR